MEVIVEIIAIISLLVFFFMAVALTNISKATRNIDRIITAWSKDTGIGHIYKCKKCKKKYSGKQPMCPHCGDIKDYS